MENNHAPSFACCLWLLSHYGGRVDYLSVVIPTSDPQLENTLVRTTPIQVAHL